MATSRWRSSLSNIETRLRRSLGLAGPIGLELPDPPPLTPVVIADDATRPGCGSELRGRRWRVTKTFSVLAGNQGSFWLFAEPPYAPSTGRPDNYSGGVIVDKIEMTFGTAIAAAVYVPQIAIFATPLAISPGIPIAVTTHDVYFVDPMKFDGEPAPLATGFDPVQTPNAARKVWEATIPMASSNFQSGLVAPNLGDIFLNWNSCLVIGNGVNAASSTALYLNVAGRVF